MCHEAIIHFRDGTPLNKTHDATYLGNNLNYAVNIAREVSQRIQDTKRTWLRLDSLWKDPSSNPKWKLLIYDAVIRSKLLYSLETVHLTGTLPTSEFIKQLRTSHSHQVMAVSNLSLNYLMREELNSLGTSFGRQTVTP